VAAAGLSAFSHGIRFAHVEAGLRTRDRREPFPEEMNRRLAGLVADLHFVPTPRARRALLAESVEESAIFLTGNTVVDSLLRMREHLRDRPVPQLLDVGGKRLLLVTAHRRESFGGPFRELCQAIREIADRFDDLHVIYPVHLNPNVREPVHDILGAHERITLTEPLPYSVFVAAMDRAHLILTDSGGVQEEAPTLGTPVLVLRNKTERPEGVTAGAVRVVGTDRARIVEQATELLGNPASHEAMARPRDIFGDGLASRRIAEVLVNGRMSTPPFEPSSVELSRDMATAP
jgi:UDP-N-acetylglucosamine 2-epimerase (non-hydrolysing)